MPENGVCTFLLTTNVLLLCLSFPWILSGLQASRSTPSGFGGNICLWSAQVVLGFLLREEQNCHDPWWAIG